VLKLPNRDGYTKSKKTYLTEHEQHGYGQIENPKTKELVQ
jgi:hypothetical protein